ncbi:MAG TPA: hypothetical protein VHJ78_07110 [Actinomycetota bacterium]|nr:hypothetical protein [Actinomycetota bacterium]
MAEFDLDTLVLERGRHSYAEQGMNVLEAVSFMSPQEKFGDKPRTVSPVIAAFLRDWNDELEDEPRQKLKSFIPRIAGSILTEDVEEFRAWVATDWLVRVQAPVWLRAAELGEFAEALTEQEAVLTPDLARAAQKLLDEAAAYANVGAKDLSKQWGEAGEEAWAKVGPKSWESAGNGVKMAVRRATNVGHRAALAASGVGLRSAARDAAAEVACDAAWDAAFMVAWKAALPVGGFNSGEAAAKAAEALRPHAEELEEKQFELLDTLLSTRKVPEEYKSKDYEGQEKRTSKDF